MIVRKEPGSGEMQVLLHLLEVPELSGVDAPPEPERVWRLLDCLEEGSEQGIVATAVGAIRLDGLFDSFFDSYWTRFTALKSVTLQCRVQGPVIVSVIRRYAVDGHEECVATWIAGADGDEAGQTTGGSGQPYTHDIALTMALPDAQALESRIFVQFETRAAGAKVIAPRWTTHQEPVRRVRLGGVITTFNREPFVQRNLHRLTGRLGQARLIIVNHGEPGLVERMAGTVSESADVRFIDQENAGGAGGFTRGMEEHFAADDITHVLLMDDDIDLPRDLLERVAAVLAYADAQICLGGAMFDFHARSRLFSAGDILLPGSFGIAHIVPEGGCDIRQTAGVDFLARVHRPDFNGWWCFAFPVDAMEKAGLPMPCFIRGDDVEYGYRLKRAGWPTLGWPGLAVWHMPFDAKAAAWHSFYDRRNALFANAIHRRVGLRAALSKLIGGFLFHLLRYDYARVDAMTRGIAAFNRGPGAMEHWTHLDHAALIAGVAVPPIPVQAQALADTAGPASRIAPSPLTPGRRAITMAARFAADLFCPWRRTGLAVLAPGRTWRADLAQRPGHVAETDDTGGLIAIYRYRWRSSWWATVRCLIALAGLVWHFRRDVPVKRPRN